MKYKISFSLLILALFAFTSCIDDLTFDESSSSINFDESDVIDIPLNLSVKDFVVNNLASTRDEEPTTESEIASDWEEQIDNIWVFQYDASSSELLIAPRYYTAQQSETNGTWKVVLKPNVASKVYIVTNVNSDSWASSYSNFMTIGDDNTTTGLLNQTIPTPYPLIDMTGNAVEGHIPMQGCNENYVTVTSSTQVEVSVERMYAKVKMRVILDRVIVEQNQAEVNYVSFDNIPWYCRVSTLYDGDAQESQDDKYPSTGSSDWISRPIEKNNFNDPNNEQLETEGLATYDYVIYMPENIQGEESNDEKDDDEKANIAPLHASKMIVSLSYLGDDGTSSNRDYTVYPGGNNYNNFNIRRNQVYRVTMNLGYPLEETYTPSSNCLVATPGSTISFEPYYRVETGGGYSFEDYLTYTEDNKTIKGIKILWQTENCIGNNTNGDLVYFEPLVSGADQTVHSKIYVTVSQPGNAVIAAYNNTDCTGDVLWSWHIWVPNEGEDPTNIATARVYYTYSWDSNGIYGYRDSSGNVTDYARIPGYSIMPCNLGALSSTPTTTSYARETYGLLYQWGRKDPFPHAVTTTTGEYNSTNIGNIYDNSHNTVQLTSKEVDTSQEDDYLFRSISGSTLKASPDNYGIAYSIKHPTVFLCGVEDANNNADSNINTTSKYVFDGNWTNEETDRLWGASELNDNTKRLFIKNDNTSTPRYLNDNYGEKSIFDPCPSNWRVSPPDLWLGFTDTGLNPGVIADNVNGSYTSSYHGFNLYLKAWRDGDQSFFPCQGTRSPDGSSYHSGTCGNYHNATADTNNRVNILHIHNSVPQFAIFEVTYRYFYTKAVGGSIRCVRDTR